ncbi:MAG TPA: PEP/pyruvate-binding domain-containing protein, partial [Gemmatimonadaceae bacterium]|nr:PEP/pyruvate-binding domain-containing protein [Gemmatimonadaceae bacterium]
MTGTLLIPPRDFPRTRVHFTDALEAELDASLVGGKAYALGRLMRSGVRVPPGFVLRTEAFDTHLVASEIGNEIRSLCEDKDFFSADARTSVSTAIRGLMCKSSLPEMIRVELLRRAASLLSRGPVVVRSSAVGEDSESASFAGQLDSVLHINDPESLERAVLTCWASYWSERALFYRAARGIQPGAMGVVVQEQVDASVAGVMFTDDGDGALLVEYGVGLADTLVSGAVDPARIRIDRATRSVTHLGERIRDAESIVATPRGIASLLNAAACIENELGKNQDVEWAMTSNGTLFVVQSRPVTAPLRQWSPARQIVWSNANVNENFPAPISPFLYSIASAGYTHYFRNLGAALGISRQRLASMEPAFAQIIGVHGGRMYYNLTNIHAVIRLAPFGEALASGFDSFVGARDDLPRPKVPRTTKKLGQMTEIVRIALRTTWQYLLLDRRLKQFECKADAFAQRSHPARLHERSLAELRGLLADFMAIRCHGWKDASLADTAAMVCYEALGRLVAHADASRLEASHTSLIKAIPGVVSNEPVHRLWALSRLIRDDDRLAHLVEVADPAAVLHAIRSDPRLAEFRSQFDAYLDEWGFRCSSELMLTTPTFQEDPLPVIALLRAYARLDADSPIQCIARQTVERETETVRVTFALSRRRILSIPWVSWAALLRVVLPWTHASIRFRERARLKQALMYSRVRRIALAIGDELVRRGMVLNRDDVFWLTVSELDELAGGGAM